MEHDVHHHQHQQLHREQEAMELPPGFRFHPTDEELITHYLARKAADPRFAPRAVGEADLNKCEPWDLPSRATMGEKEWYFFCVKDRKYPTGLRTNRATESGYWKATGKDRDIFRQGKALVGMKKTLVFYTGRAPRGGKTGWVMHEYRLHHGKHTSAGAAGSSSSLIMPSSSSSVRAGASSKEEWVLCRVFKKSIEPPPPSSSVVAGSSKQRLSSTSSSAACMIGMEDIVIGPSSMSMADDDFAACALPPLMDVSGAGGNMSLSAAAAPPEPHVTCFSNALEDQFLNPPPYLLPSAASPFLVQYGGGDAAAGMGGMVQELLRQEAAGGWYKYNSKQMGERERLSGGGASQDTGVTSEVNVNPGEISSAAAHRMDHDEASFWGF